MPVNAFATEAAAQDYAAWEVQVEQLGGDLLGSGLNAAREAAVAAAEAAQAALLAQRAHVLDSLLAVRLRAPAAPPALVVLHVRQPLSPLAQQLPRARTLVQQGFAVVRRPLPCMTLPQCACRHALKQMRREGSVWSLLAARLLHQSFPMMYVLHVGDLNRGMGQRAAFCHDIFLQRQASLSSCSTSLTICWQSSHAQMEYN